MRRAKALAVAIFIVLAHAFVFAATSCVCPRFSQDGHIDPKCCVGVPCYFDEPADAGPR